MKKNIWVVLFITLAVVYSMKTSAQTIVKVSSDGANEGNLNTTIQAAILAGTLSNTTFELERYGRYILTGTINVPAGQTLTIIGAAPGSTQDSALAQILWTASGNPDRQSIIACSGNLVMKNVWLLYATTSGNQSSSSLNFDDDPLAVNGQYGTFENVMFSYACCPRNNSGAVCVNCKKFKGSFKNCYFKNCIDSHFRYYGRALSFPYSSTGLHSDSVSFEHCTFANIGYVYMQEGGEYADYVKFNHCTFLNVVMYPLESGWWNKLIVTNCIFVNTYMHGNIPAQTGTGDPNGGTLRIDSVNKFGFSVPFTEQNRQILFSNSSYFMEKWLTDWMYNNPYSVERRSLGQTDEVPVPQPMLSPWTLRFFDSTANGQKVFPYMNRSNLYDNIDPGFLLAPTDTALIKAFLLKKWDTNNDTNWAWKPNNDINARWPLEEKLSYSNATLKAAGLGNFPLGDLYHWWPAQYVQWKAQEAAENSIINTWLTPLIIPWSFHQKTGKNGTIAVQTAINPKIGTQPLKAGDAIGVFFMRNDSLVCGGYTLWDGSQNIAITAWGDDDQTTMKDGFAEGELMQFKIWDSERGKEYFAKVEFQAGTPTYSTNGIYVLNSLIGITSVAHSIILSQGWNMISSFVAPKDSTLDSLYAKVKSRIVIMKNGSGQVYWPSFTINTIGKWKSYHGYQLYMNSKDTVTITGDEINPQQYPLSLPLGWNMISYLRNSPMRSDSALSTIDGKVVIAKNGVGQVYWPAFSINSIGNMKSGQGYQIYLNSAGTLTYPINTAAAPPSLLTKTIFADNTSSTPEPTKYRVEYINTGSNAILIAEGSGIKDGEEIGVWTQEKKLVGGGVVANGKALVTIWGDDEITEGVKEGVGEGETLTLSAWSGKERMLTLSAVMNGLTNETLEKSLRYKTDAVWIARVEEAVEAIPTEFALDQNFPNPFNPSTTIQYALPRDARVVLEIYDVLGRKIMTLVYTEQKAGYYSVQFQNRSLVSGVYFYTIVAGEFRSTKKFVLIK
ncbi:MAG: T9SS type A sorting domain-containing protein [bacterium]